MRDGLVGLDLRFRSKSRIQTRPTLGEFGVKLWHNEVVTSYLQHFCEDDVTSAQSYRVSHRTWRQHRESLLSGEHEGVTRVTRVTTGPKQQLLVFHKSCFTHWWLTSKTTAVTSSNWSSDQDAFLFSLFYIFNTSTSKNQLKCPLWFQRVWDNIFILTVLFDKHLKTQRCRGRSINEQTSHQSWNHQMFGSFAWLKTIKWLWKEKVLIGLIFFGPSAKGWMDWLIQLHFRVRRGLSGCRTTLFASSYVYKEKRLKLINSINRSVWDLWLPITPFFVYTFTWFIFAETLFQIFSHFLWTCCSYRFNKVNLVCYYEEF